MDANSGPTFLGHELELHRDTAAAIHRASDHERSTRDGKPFFGGGTGGQGQLDAASKSGGKETLSIGAKRYLNKLAVGRKPTPPAP